MTPDGSTRAGGIAATAMPAWLRPLLGLTALAAVGVPAIVVVHPPAIPRPHQRLAMPRRVVPPAELPPVEPVAYVDLAPEDAKAFNASVPFSTLPNPAARPFRFAGGADDRARATDCLAAGVVYEAGDDAQGERAVAQVVLNRLRHPAFPKTVCGVIFEGQERSTGCQFSFACDHALTRWTPTPDAWRRAREVAAAALSGSVYKPVGYATHYHTDWVVPYWQASLDKVVAVHSHLFFRWTGWWGTPPAFNRQVAAGEPVIAQLAALSTAHGGDAGPADAETQSAVFDGSVALGLFGDDVPVLLADTVTPPAAPPDADSLLVTLPKADSPDAYPAIAARACGERKVCKFSAWAYGAAPMGLPLTPAQVGSMTFSYWRDRDAGIEKTLWNCTQVKRVDRRQCMKQQVLLTATPVSASDPLGGVRRKPAPPMLGEPVPPPGSGAARP